MANLIDAKIVDLVKMCKADRVDFLHMADRDGSFPCGVIFAYGPKAMEILDIAATFATKFVEHTEAELAVQGLER